MALIDKLTAIGDAIREKNGTTEPIALADMPQAILDISSGGDSGEYDRGYAEGEAEGRKNQYDEFWDDFQQNGQRTSYAYGFAGVGWSDENFKPKYNITPIGNTGSYIFSQTRITNLKQILKDCGVTLDFSQVTTMNYPFQNSNITDVGVLDMSSMTELKYFLFGSRSLKSVEKLILKDDGSQIFNTTYAFGNCEALTHVIFDGAIGSDINIQWSPLDVESAKSIINALVNYSGTSNAFKYTVSFSGTTTELLTTEGATAPGGITWVEYADEKGWKTE